MSAFLPPAHTPPTGKGIKVANPFPPPAPQFPFSVPLFHRHRPLPSLVYPGPYEWFEQGIRRYGFHGISYHYCMERTAQILGKDLQSLRLIICHLGNGCSLTAIQEGRSIDTTMGFTPME